MQIFDNFIITSGIEGGLCALSGFAVLFIAAVINFSFAGLFEKKSQKISNAITISALLLSGILQTPALLAFLNPHSTESLKFFSGILSIGGFETALCIIAEFCILLAFLISCGHLKRLRFKQHYFNSLYLCCACALNMLLISKGFLSFMLSLEVISVCAFFIILGFKNRGIFFSAYKFLILSFAASALMIFSYAIYDIFSQDSLFVAALASVLFVSALVFKGGFAFVFERQGQGRVKYNFPAFVFLNTAVLFAYCAAFIKVFEGMIILPALTRVFFIALLCAALPLIALKIPRAKTFYSFIFSLNSLNWCLTVLALFIGTKNFCIWVLFALLNTVISSGALLSAAAIFDINKNSNADISEFLGICHTNPLYCKLLSTALFIAAGILPSGVFALRYYFSLFFLQTGLWSSVILVFALAAYMIVIWGVLNFISTMHKKPHFVKSNCGEKQTIAGVFKKRTNLNGSILFILIVLSIILYFIPLFIEL